MSPMEGPLRHGRREQADKNGPWSAVEFQDPYRFWCAQGDSNTRATDS